MIDPSEIAQARRALGRQLAQYRSAAGYNQHRLAPQTLYGRSTIANVEIGRQNVPRDFWQRCDEVLGTDGLLTSGYDQLQALVQRQRREVAEFDAQRSASSLLVTKTSSAEVSSDDRLDHAVQHPGRVDLVAVAQLEERLRRITDAYDKMPSVSLLAAAAQCQGQVATLREHAPDGRVRRELCGVEAQASILMGQLVWDASQRRDHATALAHFDHAIAAARQVSDALAEAHAILRKSYVSLYGVRQPGAGLALAAQAAHLSRGASHTLAGLALLHVAEAYGMLGNRQGCEQSLGDAQTHFSLRDNLDAAADFFSPGQFGRLAGSCYLSLNLPERAEYLLIDTIRVMQDRRKISALVLGNLTLAYIQQSKLDQATTTLHEAIDVVERTRGGGGLNVIFAAGRELRPWRRESAVEAVHDRLLALMG